MSYDPATHYDRVTAAWALLLGTDLHYGLFDEPGGALAEATARLTDEMVRTCRISPGVQVLDVGCGTGAPALHLAREFGAEVTGITTSATGVNAARERVAAAGLAESARFELRNGMDNGYPNGCFDRVWVLESSHLMRDRARLLSECARVLRPSGRLALCDIVLRRSLSFVEVRELREPLGLLRDVFGDARMEPLSVYRDLATDAGLEVETEVDLTAATRPTFARWRENAQRYREEVTALIGEPDWGKFRRSCSVLEEFWDDGVLGYGLLAAAKP